MACIYFDMGNLQESLKLCNSIVQYLKSGFYKYKKFGLLVSCLPMLLTQLGQIYAEKGNFKLAIEYGKDAISIASSSPDVLTQIYTLSWVGTIFLRKKEIMNALPLLEKSAQLCLQKVEPSVFGSQTLAIERESEPGIQPRIEAQHLADVVQLEVYILGEALAVRHENDACAVRLLGWPGSFHVKLHQATIELDGPSLFVADRLDLKELGERVDGFDADAIQTD